MGHTFEITIYAYSVNTVQAKQALPPLRPPRARRGVAVEEEGVGVSRRFRARV